MSAGRASRSISCPQPAQSQASMAAMESLLAGLIDYAGLYPPAGLDMHSALRNYKNYSRSPHSSALGRFLVNANRLTELREVAGDAARHLRLSVIASPITDRDILADLLHEGLTIDSVEIKTDRLAEIEGIGRYLSPSLTTYFEVPFQTPVETLSAIHAVGARVKLRMGGVVASAFPPAPMVASMLKVLVDRRTPFKATAGLHHPIRSHHAFTNEPDSPAGIMHGFLNLLCAAALLYFG